MRASHERLVFPAYYIELVESLIRARQGDLAQIVSRCGLTPAQLQQRDQPLTLAQFQALLQLGLEHGLPGEPLFLQAMRHLPVTAHGLVGMAAMTADTLNEALDVALHYFPLLMPALELYRETVGNETQVVIQRHHDFGAPLNALLTELVVGSLNRMGEFASAPQLRAHGQRFSMKVQFTHACPGDAAAYDAFFGQPVVFGAPVNKFIIARHVLSQPLLTRNRTTRQALEATLDRQLQALPQQMQMTQRVRRLLAQAIARGHLPHAEEVASELAMSVRTLSRRLREEGTTLLAITEAVRIERAELLLIGSDLPLGKVAQQLGFSDLSTFSRAFKRVRGVAPGELRRS
ncbi:MAG: AraC family transcriptional regulator [Moraxellaceae bacterium]|jgi:AraC-like DNA-binding protein|nr:AraC family transcriptional regulator [Moraxellaceae bacterium]